MFTLWLFNIAMENGSFIDGVPIKNDDFPWFVLKKTQDEGMARRAIPESGASNPLVPSFQC